MDWPPRILHVIDRLDGYGASRMLRHLAARQAEAGARVTVVALAADAAVLNSLRQVGVETPVFPSRGTWDVLALARLRSMAVRADADVVHAWHPLVLGVVAIAKRGARKTALVATVEQPGSRRTWTTPAMKWLGRRVDGFAAVDEAAYAWGKGMGVAPEAISHIRPGVAAPHSASRDRESVLAELSIPSGAPLIAIAAPLRRPKAIDETIWCFELVRVLYPEARLLVAGDGPDRPRLERFASQVSEPGYVRFLDFRDDLPELLQHVDVYWQLNAAATTPWALLEALAAAVPVVAADVPAHRAVLAGSQTNWLTPPDGRAEVARATDQILREPNAARQRARETAATVLATWSLETAFDSYRDLYRRAAQRAATPR